MKEHDSLNQEMAFFDLDGTIINSCINNTFDFIKMYFEYNNKYLRLNLEKIYRILIMFLPLNEHFKWKILIYLMFCNLNYKDLINFADDIYINKIFKKFNDEVINKIRLYKEKNYKLILLTSCTEIPAKTIASYFNFDECICTLFKKRNGKIIGVEEDTFRDLKISAIKKRGYDKLEPFQNAVYFTDTPKKEENLIKIFCLTYQIKNNKIFLVVEHND
jgi:phosphoserine phosphatase